MNENIGSVVLTDESVTLTIVKPLHFSCHFRQRQTSCDANAVIIAMMATMSSHLIDKKGLVRVSQEVTKQCLGIHDLATADHSCQLPASKPLLGDALVRV